MKVVAVVTRVPSILLQCQSNSTFIFNHDYDHITLSPSTDLGAPLLFMASAELPLTVTATERAAFVQLALKQAKARQRLDLTTSKTIDKSHMEACFKLIESTSAAAYRASSKGWSPAEKREEMHTEGIRYLLLFSADQTETKTAGQGAGDDIPMAFLSYLPTLEADPESDPPEVKTLYIYEVHVQPAHQNQGLGLMLLKAADSLAVSLGLQKTMLTVFISNEAALRLYTRHGYEKWDEEYIARRWVRLRTGMKEIRPSYVILARSVT